MKHGTICILAAGAAALIALQACGGVPNGITEDPGNTVLTSESPLPTGSAAPPEMDLTPKQGVDAVHEGGEKGEKGESVKTTSVILHYLTDDGFVLPLRTEIPAEDGIARACLTRLTAGGGSDAELAAKGLRAPIPEDAQISLVIANGEAIADISSASLPDNAEIERAMFAAVVNTLMQFRSVDTVTLTVNGRSGMTENGNITPERCGSYALNVEQDSLEASAAGECTALTLYFPTESGSAFIPVTRYVGGKGGLGSAIAQLAEGTKLKGLRACFPQNTLILGAAIENGVLTVNCSKDFTAIEQQPGLFSLAMNSVMMTASRFGSVDEVCFAVNGSPYEP